MAKIKINKLPEGFKLVDGKIEKNQSMKHGGYVTGDLEYFLSSNLFVKSPNKRY